MTLADALRDAPTVDRGGYSYMVHPLLDGVPRVDPALLAQARDWVLEQEDLVAKATLILAPEAMGLPLAAAVALASGLPYVVARKRAYGLPGEQAVDVTTGYHRTRLHLNDVAPRDRVLVVDVVVSTGATLEAVLGALGPVSVGALVLLDKTGVAARLAARHGVPVRAMCRMGGGRPVGHEGANGAPARPDGQDPTDKGA